MNSINESRKYLESQDAIEGLKLVWGLRGIGSLILIAGATYFAFKMIVSLNQEDITPLFGMVVVIAVFAAEFFFIVQFFKGKKSSVTPLNVLSVMHLINFPLGTGFSIYHFFKIKKVIWEAEAQ